MKNRNCRLFLRVALSVADHRFLCRSGPYFFLPDEENDKGNDKNGWEGSHFCQRILASSQLQHRVSQSSRGMLGSCAVNPAPDNRLEDGRGEHTCTTDN